MHGPREVVAHAATPWEWRSRTAVVVLVVGMVALTTAVVVRAWTDDVSSKIAWTIACGVLGTLLFVRPAVRSLRRWDERHKASYAIVLPDGTYGPRFPKLDEAAAWALENLPDDSLDGWVSVAVTENGQTNVSTGITLSRSEQT